MKKQVPANPASQVVVKVVVDRKRRAMFVVAIVAGILIVLGAAVWAVFYRNDVNQETVLTDSQNRTKDTISAQEQLIQEQQGGSDAAQAAMHGNLAQSYAYTGDCESAHREFGKAKVLAPVGSQAGLQRTEEYIKGYCP